MDQSEARRRVALPGDPELDCDVEGITVTSVIVEQNSQELLVGLSGGTGAWVDADAGRSGPVSTAPRDLQVTHGLLQMQFPQMPAQQFAEYVEMLHRWRDTATPLRLLMAPGKVSTLIEDRDRYLLLPRRWPPAAEDVR